MDRRNNPKRNSTPMARLLSVVVSMSMALSLMPGQGLVWAQRQAAQVRAVAVSDVEGGAETLINGMASDGLPSPSEEQAPSEEESAPSESVATVPEEQQTQSEPAIEPVQQEVATEPEHPVITPAEAEGEKAVEEADERNAQETLTYEDDSVKVTASLTEPAALPKDVELVVTPVTAQTPAYNYDAYMEALDAASGDAVEHDEQNTLLYDVAFLTTDEGGNLVEVEPDEGTVTVNFEFKRGQLTQDLGAEGTNDVAVTHLPLAEGVVEDAGTTARASDISASDVSVELVDAQVSGDAATMVVESFSIYAFSYTVDFTYDGYTYSITGESDILLSTLFMTLGIDVDVADVTSVEFTDESLVKVEKLGDDWRLISLKPFDTDEKLTATLKNGSKYVIDVTDDATLQTDLNYFLENVTITGLVLNEDQTYTAVEGQRYSIDMRFTEGADYQFNDRGTLTYQMPEGVKILDDGISDSEMIITVHTHEGNKRVSAHYTITPSGQLVVTFDTFDPEFEYLESATDVSFHVSYYAEFERNATFTKFNDGVARIVNVNPPEPGSVNISKTGTVNPDTMQMEYVITVTAAGGDVEDVNVWDYFESNNPALTLTAGSIQVSSSNGTVPHYTDNQTEGRTFDYTFDSMVEGEIITIAYTADVHLDKDSDNDGKITVDQTKNKLAATTKTHPNPVQTEFHNEINYRSTQKSDGTESEQTDGQGNKIIDWTIEYNKELLVSAKGTPIVDTIGYWSRDYMTYYGDGITVEVYDENGSLVETRPVSYESMGANAWTWTYTIPDDDTEVYRYVIKYQTKVDQSKVDQVGANVTLTNDGNGDGGGITIGPAEEVGIEKSHTSVSTSEITWVGTISVPKAGLSKAVVVDTFPRKNDSTEYDYVDSLDINDISIDGLLPGEEKTITPAQRQVTITFFKDAAKTLEGLQPSSETRTITVTMKFKVNQEWLKHDFDAYGNSKHTNQITINGKPSTDTVTLIKPGMVKAVRNPADEEEITEAVNNSDKAIDYTLLLTGVSSDTFDIVDQFDTSLFEVDDTLNDPWLNMTICGGLNQWGQQIGTYHYPITITNNPDNQGVTIHVDGVPKNANGGYYDYYKIRYRLKIKGDKTLQDLAAEKGVAVDGAAVKDIENTAIWGIADAGCTFKTKYKPLTKELLNGGEIGSDNRDAEFKITYNPSMATLFGGAEKELTDTMNSYLAVDASSIHVDAWNANGMLPDGSIVYKVDDYKETGSTVVTYYIPDATKVEITYTAKVLGNGDVQIQNEATVQGYSDDVIETKDMGTAGDGDANLVELKILKVDAYNQNKKLRGVRFKFYASDGRPVSTDGHTELHYTTGDDGTFTIEGGESDDDGVKAEIFFDLEYKLEEIEPPADYSRMPYAYSYTFTKDASQVNHQNYVYFVDDSAHIENWPLEGLVLEKEVEGGDESDNDKEFTFYVTAKSPVDNTLPQDQWVYQPVNGKSGDDWFKDGEVWTVTTKKDADGKTVVDEWLHKGITIKPGVQKQFWGFKKGTKYIVTESFTGDDGALYTTTDVTYDVIVLDADGKVVSRTPHTNENVEDRSYEGELTSGTYETVKFTNHKVQKGSLNIKKNVTVNSEQPTESNKAVADGTFTYVVKGPGSDGAEQTVTVEVVDGVPATTTVSDLEPGAYTVTELTDAEHMPANWTLAQSVDNPQTVQVVAGESTEVPTAEFTNDYTYEAKGEVKVKKTLSGRDWETDDSFKFTIAPVGGAPAFSPDTATVTKDSENYTASFGEVTLTAPGTYEWTVTEEHAGETINGVTYDSTSKTVTIKVKDDGRGHLVADDDSALVQTAAFENTYKPDDVEVTLKATKSLAGREWADDDSFDFKIEATGANAGTAPMPEEAEISATKDHKTVSWGTMTFSKAGTWTYKVTEPAGTADGVAYDAQEYLVEVIVTDDKAGKLVATVKVNGEVVSADDDHAFEVGTFTNVFTKATAELEATKAFNDWGKAESFTFKLTPVDGAPMPADAQDGAVTKPVTQANPTAKFGEIDYTKAGVYEYTIQEVVPENKVKGVTYDETEHKATVTVTKANDATNALTATVKYDDRDSLTITNTYDDASATIQVTKSFSDWGKADSFSFKLTPVDGAPMPADNAIAADGSLTKSVTEDIPVAVFGMIEYTRADDYQYKLQELDDGVVGVNYDTTEHLVVVHVAKNEQGKLVARTLYDATYNEESSSYSGEDALSITNTFTPAKATVKAKKVYNGDVDWGKASSFTFTLARATEGAPMPGTATATATKDAPVAAWAELEFDTIGDYKYTITERDDHVPGVTYDTTPHEVTVKVAKADGDSNALVAKVEYSKKDADAEEITNTFTPVTTHFEAEKGFEDWGRADSFTFRLAADNGRNAEGVVSPMPADGTTVRVTEQNKRAVFGDIDFDAVGTYHYTITEDNDGKPGVSYDTTPHAVEVVVSAGQGNELVADVTYDDEAALVITNTFSEAKARLEVTKEFDDWGKAESFTFDLAAKEAKDRFGKAIAPADMPMPATTTATATQGDNPARFGEMAFGTPGTYVYAITERNGGADGVTYDTSEHTATVTVTKAEDATNALSAAVTYDGDKDGLTVTNTYRGAEAQVEVTKVYGDRDSRWGAADEFDFELTAGAATYADGTTGTSPLPGTAQDGKLTAKATAASRMAVFDKIPFDKAGTYTYYVRELEGGKDYVTYDTTLHPVTVTVAKDSQTNALSATVGYGDAGDPQGALTVTNEYNTRGEITLSGTKELRNRALKAGEFTFELYDGAIEDGEEPLRTATNAADGSYHFTKLTYTGADLDTNPDGTYKTTEKYYTVVERAGSDPSVTYDATTYPVTVTLTDDGEGTIDAVANPANGSYDFENTYDAKGSVDFEGTKVMDGRDFQVGDKYTFTIKGGTDKTPLPESPSVTIEPTSGSTASIDFGKTDYDLSDLDDAEVDESGARTKTFTYTVSETGTVDGVALAEAQTVTVTVTDDGSGALKVEKDGEEVQKVSVSFTNKFTAAKKALEVTKSIDDWGDAKKFGFTLTAGTATYADGTTGTSPMPKAENGSKATATPTALTARFGEIEFDRAGTYAYTINEVNDHVPGVTYDTTDKLATVSVVRDPSTNALSATVVYGEGDAQSDTLTVANSYASQKATLQVTKSINDWGKTDRSFDFTLTAGTATHADETTGTSPMSAEAGEATTLTKTATKGNPTADFGEIEYKTAGVYNYTIEERKGTLGGVTYDDTVYSVVVTVSADEQTNKLDADVVYKQKDGTDGESLTVANAYAAEGAAQLWAQKDLSGREVKEGEFSFTLTGRNVNGAKHADGSQTVKMSKNDDQNRTLFDEISYDLADMVKNADGGYDDTTYVYTIKEVVPKDEEKLPGVTYDNTEARVQVTLHDDGAGTITTTYKNLTEDNSDAGYTFENTYDATGKLVLEGHKAIANKPDSMDLSGFKFSVKNAAGEKVATATSDADGNIKFTAINYTLDDRGKTYTYTVAEDASEVKPGVTNSTATQSVTVRVEDDGEGHLEPVLVAGDSTTVASIKAVNFTNTYNAAGGFSFEGVSKKLTGRELNANEYAFVVKEVASSTVVANGTVNEDGSVTFDHNYISYMLDQAGTKNAPKKYTYVVSEVVPEAGSELGGITYDTSAKSIEVSVYDGGDGKIYVNEEYNPTISFDKQFKNTYEANGEVVIQATKHINGRQLNADDAGKFTFRLAGPKIDGYQEKTIGATGVVTFDSIKYTQEDIADAPKKDGKRTKQFEYTITEVSQTTLGGFEGQNAFDTHEEKVIVTVVDKLDGSPLEATAAYDEEGALFTNNYDTKGDITLSGTKTLQNRKLEEGEFTFELYEDVVDESEKPLQTTTNAADGSYSFQKIEYTGADLEKDASGNYVTTTKTYTVVEKAGTDSSVTYATKTYPITVTLTDNGDGTMQVSANPAANAYDFTNTYDTKGEITLSGTKTLQNRTLKPGEFSFTLTATDAQGNALTGDAAYTETVTNAADGSYSFKALKYTGDDLDKNEDGTYKETKKYYKVKEEVGTAARMTYATTEYVVTVTLRDNGKGKINVAADPAENAYDFTNTYTPDKPKFEKKIMDTNDSGDVEGHDGIWNDSADYDIGDLVPYKLTAILAKDVTSYKKYHITFEDQMEDTLTFNSIQKVTLNGQNVSKGNYELVKDDDQNFSVTLRWEGEGGGEIVDADLNEAEVCVYFDARLNANANLGSEGNVNGARLHYSSNPSSDSDGDKDERELPWDYVIAFTYRYDVSKVDDRGNAVKGVKFALYKKYVTKPSDDAVAYAETGQYADYYKVGEEKKSDSNVFSWRGIDDGDYLLVETTVPEGFQGPSVYPFKVEAGHATTWDYTSAKYNATPTAEGVAKRTEILESLTGQKTSGLITFQTKGEGDDAKYLEATATNRELVKVPVTKQWVNPEGVDAGWPEGVEVDIELWRKKQDGSEDQRAHYVSNNDDLKDCRVTLSGNNRGHTFEDALKENGWLEKYYTDDEGKVQEYIYYLKELSITKDGHDVSGYTSTLPTGPNAAGNWVIANTEEGGSLTVTKTVNGVPSSAGDKTYTVYVSRTIGEGEDAVTTYYWKDAKGAQHHGSEQTGTTIAASESLTFTSLPAGTYDIAENEKDAKIDDYTLTVTGDKTAQLPTNGEVSATITNTYEREKGDFQLKKVVTGTSDGTKDFSFKVKFTAPEEVTFDADGYTYKIYDADENVREQGTITDVTQDYEVTLKAGEVFEVVGLPVGTTWVVDEPQASVPDGYKFDGVQGNINAIQKGTVALVTATNAYDATGSAQLSAKKAESTTLGDRTFRFQLLDADDNDRLVETSDPVMQGETAEFAPIEYALADLGGAASRTFNYKIREAVPEGATAGNNYTVDGVRYDTGVHEVPITVSDEGDGTLGVRYGTATEFAAPVFANGYDAAGSIDFNGSKAMDGRDFREGDEYTFTVTGDAPLPEETSVTIRPTEGKRADFTFGKVNYTLADLGGASQRDFAYTVTETGTVDGVAIDTAKVVRVTVSDNGDGTLKVTKTGETAAIDAVYADFTNVFTPATASIAATKQINDWGAAKSFTFTLEPKDDAPMPVGATGGSVVKTVTKDQLTARFGDIAYNKAGTYNYTITETDDGVDGVTYDTKPHDVTVTVSKSATNALSAEVKYDGQDSLIIVNSFESASASLQATKSINNWGTAESFTFTLEPEDGAPMPAGAVGGKVVKTITKDQLTARFGEIEYRDSGTYGYTITETDDGVAGITYDAKAHDVEVKVGKRDGSNELEVKSITYDGEASLTIANEYRATGGAELWAQKALSGRAARDDEFSFVLSGPKVGENGTETITNKGEGRVSFTPIAYDLSDLDQEADGSFVTYKPTTLTYHIKEVIPQKDERVRGVTYDATDAVIEVTLTDDGEGHILTSYKNRTSNGNARGYEFKNTYDTRGEVTLSGTKELRNHALKAGEFAFELYAVDAEGNVAETPIETVSNAADGRYRFTKLTYTGADLGKDENGKFVQATKRYKVVEKPGTLRGVEYDDTEYDVMVTLKDQGDGTMQVTADPAENTYDFTNTYTPDKPEFGKKIMDTNDSGNVEGHDGIWNDSADYDIGDLVPYKLTATLADDVTEYHKYHITFNDQMEESLTFASVDNIKSVKVIGADGKEITRGFQVERTRLNDQQFTVKVSWAGEGEKGLIADTNLNGATVEVEFEAQLNSKAKLGKEGNVNGAQLLYSNKPSDFDDKEENERETPWDYVIVFTYEVDVNKVDPEGKSLAGATFKLEKKLADGSRALVKEYTLDDKLTTFSFRGLDDGDYILTETKSPKGYKLIDPVEFTVTADHTLVWAENVHGGVAPTIDGESKTMVLDGRDAILLKLGAEQTGEVAQFTFGEADDVETGFIATGVIPADAQNHPHDTPEFEKKTADVNDSQKTIVPAEVYLDRTWQDAADYDIDDDVPFRLHAVLADDVTDYRNYHITFTDQTEKSLTFNEKSVEVYLGSQKLNADEYELVKTDDQNFTVTLSWHGEGKGDAQKQIADETLNGADVYVYFTAKLTGSDVVLGDRGNINGCKLTYSNNSTSDDSEDDWSEKPWDYVIIFTYQTDVNKVDQDGKELAGAKFELFKQLADGTLKSVKQDVTLSTGAKFAFKGLDDGTYVLKETEAPAGYQPIEDITFTVTATHLEGDNEWTNTALMPKFAFLPDQIEPARTGVLTLLGGSEVKGEEEEGRIVFDTGEMVRTSGIVAGTVANQGFADLLVSKAYDHTVADDDEAAREISWQFSLDLEGGLEDAYPTLRDGEGNEVLSRNDKPMIAVPATWQRAGGDEDVIINFEANGDGTYSYYDEARWDAMGDFLFGLKAGEGLLVRQLPVGTRYVAQEWHGERPDGTLADGFGLVRTELDGADATELDADGHVAPAVTGTVGKAVDGIRTEALFTNGTTYQLSVMKANNGLPEDEEEREALLRSIRFTVTGPDGFSESRTLAEFDADPASGDLVWTLEGLEPGDYAVGESREGDVEAGGTASEVTFDGGSEADGGASARAFRVDGERPIVARASNRYFGVTRTARLAVTKVIGGDAEAYEGTGPFTFVLARAEGSTGTDDVLPARDRVTVTRNEDGTWPVAAYDNIAYGVAEGTYYYTITEARGSTPGMAYAEPIWVRVDNAATDPDLVPTIRYGTEADVRAGKGTEYAYAEGDGIPLTNTFTPGRAELEAGKAFSEEGDAYEGDEEFELTLAGVSATGADGTEPGGVPMPGTTTVKVRAGETGSFGTAAYATPGTYLYTITETAGETPGVTYATEPTWARVDVTEGEDHALAARVTYGTEDEARGGTATAEVGTVTNAYHNDYFFKVKKTVVSTRDADKDYDYKFKVTLYQGEDTKDVYKLTGTYGDMEFKDGVAELTLRDGEVAKADGFEDNVYYKVEETDANGLLSTQTKSDLTGTTTVTNTYTPDSYFFRVRKVVVSTRDADKDYDYRFKVTLYATEDMKDVYKLTGTFGDLEFTDGVAEFTLRDGETATASGFGDPVYYIVEETDAGGLRSTQATSKLTGTTTVTNTYTPDSYFFKVRKVVDSTRDEDKERDYKFKVTLYLTEDKDDVLKLTGTYGDMEFTDGVAELTLRDGETATASGFDRQVWYAVEETDSHGLVSTKSENKVTHITTVTNKYTPPTTPPTTPPKGSTTSTGTSTRTSTPKTGDPTNVAAMVGIVALGAMAIAVGLARRRREH